MNADIRVRFAPSPTGFMHLGNVRAALFNYLFAEHHQGTFVLRIEDTDASRNLDVASQKIFDDLKWLGLSYDEGPVVGGKYAPYNQSDRSRHYEKHLNELIANQKVYRCFCTTEDLGKKRERQIALKKPPRYDRTCLHLSEEKVKDKVVHGIPFVWRFALNSDQLITIRDLAKGDVNFEMHNFADFPLTRSDGSFTFMFANFVDDWEMKITHVLRGEDHLSNTALQAALYDAFAVQLPTFWHLPMICNVEGKKLSKRDFGFSLDDLIQDGFLPEAVVNYLATIGVSSEQEVQSLEELVKSYDFSHVSGAAAVRYSVEKLIWFNHQWIQKISIDRLVSLCMPFLEKEFDKKVVSLVKDLDQKILLVRSEMKQLGDILSLLRFCFVEPVYSRTALLEVVPEEKFSLVQSLLQVGLNDATNPDVFVEKMKQELKMQKGLASFFWKSLRYALTGAFSGMNFKDCSQLLAKDQLESRIQKLLK